jgi:hypothetical protein
MEVEWEERRKGYFKSKTEPPKKWDEIPGVNKGKNESQIAIVTLSVFIVLE